MFRLPYADREKQMEYIREYMRKRRATARVRRMKELQRYYDVSTQHYRIPKVDVDDGLVVIRVRR